MANITVANSTYQAGPNDTASTLSNDAVPGDGSGSQIRAEHINGLTTAAVQVETILGSGPDLKGSTADLVARLAIQILPTGKFLVTGGGGLTDKRVLYGGSTGLLRDDATFRFDDTTKTLYLDQQGSGGLVIGLDTQWYRASADVLRTPDAVIVDGASTLTGLLTLGNHITKTDDLNLTLTGGTTRNFNITNSTASQVVNIVLDGLLRQQNNTAFTYDLVCTPTANRVFTFPDTTDTVAVLAEVQTLTNKTINLASNTLTGTTAQFNTALSDDDFATLTNAVTLTNKILGATVLAGTLSRAADQTIDLTGAATRILTIENSTASQVCIVDVDGSYRLRNNTAFYMELVGTPTANRVFTLPDVASDIVAVLAAAQTLTNKTVNLSSNTLSGTTAQFNTALSDGDFATLAGTEVLTNKTVSALSNQQKLNIQATSASVPDQTAEQTVYTYTLPGGSLGTTRGVRVYVKLAHGSTGTYTWRMKYGGTTLTTISVAATASGEAVFRTDIFSNASATAQHAVCEMHFMDGTVNTPQIVTGTSTIASGSDQTIEFTQAQSTTGMGVTKRSFVVEPL